MWLTRPYPRPCTFHGGQLWNLECLPLPATHRILLKYLPDITLSPGLRPLARPQPPPHACAVSGHRPAARDQDACFPTASDSLTTPRPEPARPITCQVLGLPATDQSRASPPAVAFRQWEKARGPGRQGARTPQARRRRQRRAQREHNMAVGRPDRTTAVATQGK